MSSLNSPDTRRGVPSVGAYSDDVATITPIRPRPTVLEFFAGIGLARIGLEASGFKVVWANDYEPDKRALYSAHFRDSDNDLHYVVGDVRSVEPDELPRGASVAWASSPCTDLSLAGNRDGLNGRESNAFWSWVALLGGMKNQAPEVLVLENVTGLATSHGGDDLRAAIRGLNEIGYSIDLLAIDARRFLPQSRPRLFLVGAKNPPSQGDRELDSELRPEWVQSFYGDPGLRMHRASLPAPPPYLLSGFGDVVEHMRSDDERWWDDSRTSAFVSSLSDLQRERVETLRASANLSFRTAYRRTRAGRPVWEVRADDVSGCLRTARGGSSKQAVVLAGKGELRVRWMTPTEYARLMGAGDYNLAGARNNQALFAFGDAVAVPVVEWLATEYLYPLVMGTLGSQPRMHLQNIV